MLFGVIIVIVLTWSVEGSPIKNLLGTESTGNLIRTRRSTSGDMLYKMPSKFKPNDLINVTGKVTEDKSEKLAFSLITGASEPDLKNVVCDVEVTGDSLVATIIKDGKIVRTKEETVNRNFEPDSNLFKLRFKVREGQNGEENALDLFFGVNGDSSPDRLQIPLLFDLENIDTFLSFNQGFQKLDSLEFSFA